MTMNTIINKFLVLVSLVIICASCSDFFESVIEVDPPEHTPQLVLHAVLTDNFEENATIAITESIGILEPRFNNDDGVVGAVVTVSGENGDVNFLPNPYSPDTYHADLSDFDLKGLGDELQIHVSHIQILQQFTQDKNGQKKLWSNLPN